MSECGGGGYDDNTETTTDEEIKRMEYLHAALHICFQVQEQSMDKV